MPRLRSPRPGSAFDNTDWSTNTELRIHCLEQLHQALTEHREELAALTTTEVGATAALCAGAHTGPVRSTSCGTTPSCSRPTR